MWLFEKNGENKLDRKDNNEAVLKIVGERQVMVDVIIQRKKNWIGHVVRGDGLLR